MNKYPEFWAAFLGGLPLGTLFAAIAWALFGLFVRSSLKGLNRDQLSERTPYKWSWKFFFQDNLPRLAKSAVTTILVIFASIRFVKEWTGSELSMFYAFGIGIGFDYVVDKISNMVKKPNQSK